jgi:glycerophosphoryl diester phosphodiesterase
VSPLRDRNPGIARTAATDRPPAYAPAMVRVIAHRGASAAAPENTIEAFRLARELGADWVELDARRTTDGKVIVHHDADLADGRVIVETERADLPAPVCDLTDALDACEGMSINIEIKNWPADPDFDETELVARFVVDLVQERSLHDRVLISCFHYPTIQLVRELDPTIPTAFLHILVDRSWDDLAADVAAAGHTALHPWDGLVDESLVAAARANGLEVNVWTVDDPDRMAELIALGVDGLCTNTPDVARSVVNAS